MKTENNMMVTVPSAYVTKRKQRIKQYDNTVYLKNGDEFEIELFNPTQNKVLAKIEINGNTIGGSGIVLRPGERVFLERYISESKKFLFETYKVNGSNADVQKAIANNGDVIVKFYQQYFIPSININPWPQWNYNLYYSTGPTYPFNGLITTTTGGSAVNPTFSNSGSSNISYLRDAGSSVTTDSVETTFTSNSATFSTLSDKIKPRSLKKESLNSDVKQIETGRVEKGSYSAQSFEYDYTNFNSYYSWMSSWKILPVSQKEVVIEDLQTFCTECGSKRKKDSHKFCPICGTKF